MASTTDKAFGQIVRDSVSFAQVSRRLGLRVQGSNYCTLKRRIERQGLSTSHFDPNWSAARFKNTRPLIELLVQNCPHHVSSNDLKKRLVREGLLVYHCAECDNDGTWRGKQLTLQLDHRNGDHCDNQIDNLRLLCPNCHTQTPTHSGKRHRRRATHCPECTREFEGYGARCHWCANKDRTHTEVYTWPTDDQIQTRVWEQRPEVLSKEIGCSYTSLRKRCKRRGIKLPPRGYWIRRACGYSHDDALSPRVLTPSYHKTTDTSRREMVRLHLEGKTHREIGEALDCHHTSVSRWLAKLVPQPRI